jgi:hypothetical protein
MRNLLAYTCLTPLALIAVAGTARAETTVTTKQTSGIKTSTIKSGAADDIKITSTGSVVPTASGAAVTIDSNHAVKNEGAIQTTGVSNSTGILAQTGTAGNITNTGKIELLEDYTPTDTDKDGDIDGPFAQGSNRFGIRLAPGGTFTGKIDNSGTITIEGNNSAGIAADAKLVGSIANSGTISVVGDNAVGIRTTEVTGDIRVTGSVAAVGVGATGISLQGDTGGAFVVQGTVASTGYRYTTSPADPSKLDADDLLQGGPAIRIAGDVAKGVLFDAPPPNNSADDKDEDDDGIEDANEKTAEIFSYGSAAAVEIGAADHAVDIGAVAGAANGHGLVIKGNLQGLGVYAGVNATGLAVGGLGGAVNIAGGITVNGGIGALSNGGSATAIRIGNGATVPEIRVGGTVVAQGGDKAASLSRGILIEQGANVATIRNSGNIQALAAGEGTAASIVDKSGHVTLVENSGNIAAGGVATSTGRAIAIDLSANGSGATVRQLLAAQNASGPTISGNILFGGGDDLLDVADGFVTGDTKFGAGANRLLLGGDAVYTGNAQFGAGADMVTLGGTSVLAGGLDFGGGADTLTLTGTSRFTGNLAGSAGLAVNVTGGTFAATNTGTVHLASLNIGGQGTLGVTIDGTAGKATLYQVAGAASFGQGTKVQIQLANVSNSVGTFTVVKAGTLTGTAGLTATSVMLPVFLKSSVSANETAGEVSVSIGRKSDAELGLNRSEGSAWDAVFKALDADGQVAKAFLAMTETGTLKTSLQQLMPDHAGGVFEAVTQGSRASARFLRDPNAPFADRGAWGFWLQQAAWGTAKDIGETSSYDISGWGASGGAEVKLGALGNVGLSLGYLNGRDSNGDNDNEVRADAFEVGAYWRGQWGGLRAYARGSYGFVSLDGTRTFTAVVAGDPVTRTATADWNGNLFSAIAGVSYEHSFGRFSLRPAVSVDYYRLSEDGYGETGGGAAMDLTVDDRTSDEAAVEATLTGGYDFMRKEPEGGWLRAEIEGGRRQLIGGELGQTTARFGTGNPFTLNPEERTDGWVGKLRLMGGNEDFSLGGEFSAEEQQNRAAVAFRATLQFAF